MIEKTIEISSKDALPNNLWGTYQKTIKKIAEDHEDIEEEDFLFLESIGFVSKIGSGFIPLEACTEYYDAVYISNNDERALQILRRGLLIHPAVQLILQLLHGVKDATRQNALSILKSRGLWAYSNEKPLTNLLILMNSTNLIIYSNKHGTIKVVFTPDSSEESLPANIFIDPSLPYGNKMWLNKILSDCKEYIYWIDKHFTSSGLEFIWESADANKVKKIIVLSLYLENLHGKNFIKKYKELKQELAIKGIEFQWNVIDSKLIRDNHDRWILSKGSAWNLPDLNTITTGNRSEITKSPHGSEMEKAFAKYLPMSREISD